MYMMTVKNLVWGILGLLMGLMINNLVIKSSNVLKLKNKHVQNGIQILLCSVFLAGLHHYNNYFGWTWQNVTPGLFFVSFFFGAQFKIFTNSGVDYVINETV